MTVRTFDPRPPALPLIVRQPMTPKLAAATFLLAARTHPDFGRTQEQS